MLDTFHRVLPPWTPSSSRLHGRGREDYQGNRGPSYKGLPTLTTHFAQGWRWQGDLLEKLWCTICLCRLFCDRIASTCLCLMLWFVMCCLYAMLCSNKIVLENKHCSWKKKKWSRPLKENISTYPHPLFRVLLPHSEVCTLKENMLLEQKVNTISHRSLGTAESLGNWGCSCNKLCVNGTKLSTLNSCSYPDDCFSATSVRQSWRSPIHSNQFRLLYHSWTSVNTIEQCFCASCL